MRIAWAGFGWALASLVVAGFFWLRSPAGSGGYGGLKGLNFILWPMSVWPWAIVGGVVGGFMWSVFESDGSHTMGKVWTWTGWILGGVPMFLFVAVLASLFVR